MKVFIPVFFNAPLGGLQSHVMSQCLALKKEGAEPLVMCKPGPFTEQLRHADIDVLNSDFTDISQATAEAVTAGPFDLVHAHPFRSRKVGLQISKKMSCPFIVTYHGCYEDELSFWSNEVDIIIAVSAAVRDFLLSKNCIAPTKILTIPNGVNLDVFFPKKIENSKDFPANPCSKKLLLVSRLDNDKKLIIDAVRDTWENCINKLVFSWDWLIAGDGKLRDSMELEAERVNQIANRKIVSFLGWQSELELANLYNNADLVIGPGRCAIEAMACGTPVIAIGSKTYIGLVDQDNFNDAIYSNFGGGTKSTLVTGNMFNEIQEIVNDKKQLLLLGKGCQQLVKSYFDQQLLDSQLLSVYKLITCGPIIKASYVCREVTSKSWSFREPDSDCLSSSWSTNAKADKLLLSFDNNNSLIAQCVFGNSEHAYIATSSTDFKRASPTPADYLIEKNATYEITLSMEPLEGSVSVGAWFIEYDELNRIQHTHKNLTPGNNKLIHKTSPQAHSFQFALRFSRKGVVKISSFKLFKQYNTDLISYEGDNLVFIVGPPRSGTTWVLRVLREHQNVVHATVDNLNAKVNKNTTWETNIFNDTRPFTDSQIKQKFYSLSCMNSSKIIVEKTPIHLLYVNRIKKIFPKSNIVLTLRDGKDIAASIMCIGRNPNAWWKGCPSNVEKAAKLLNPYLIAALDCLKNYEPILIKYELLTQNPAKELSILFEQLDLQTSELDKYILNCSSAASVPFEGFDNGGKVGLYKEVFTEEEDAVFNKVNGNLLQLLGY